MGRIFYITLTGLLAIYYVQCASLNNASVRPRGERAESSGIDISPKSTINNKQNAKTNGSSSDQLEFDFVSLPGYGILDEKNSSLQGNFSCFERRYGYYADINKRCSLFHLCYPVKDATTNEIIYQRFSFACSDNSIFDQQHLLCLDESSLVTKCENSADYFDSSNQRLVTSLQQSAPGLFQLSEEGAIINTTSTASTQKIPEQFEASASEPNGEETIAVQPASVYGFHDPTFV